VITEYGSNMNGQQGYWNSIESAMTVQFESMITDKKVFYEAIGNNLFNLEGRHRLPRSHSKSDRQISLVFQGYYEISKSYDNLTDIRVYLQRLPSQKSGISKVRYISYHLENYINEAYILENRLKTYATILLRKNKNLASDEYIEKIRAPLFELVKETFKNIHALRGVHVHQSRFSDDDLERALVWELIIVYDPSSLNPNLVKIPEFKQMTNYSLRKARKKWVDYVTSSNEAVKKILDAYFDTLYPIVFDENNKIRYPK
jgi:hypothetical protein